MSEVMINDKALTALQAYQRQYRIAHMDRLRELNQKHREIHKERIAARSKKYYEDNLEKVKAWQGTKVECSCGGRYTLTNKAQHEKRDIHIKSLETV